MSAGVATIGGVETPSVLMYSRPRCGLCDEAREVLMSVRSTVPFDFAEVDIDTDDQLVKDYGIRIPVVLVDGLEMFEYRVDADGFRAALRGRP